MGPRQVRAVLAAGAAAAMRDRLPAQPPESGAHPLHKAATSPTPLHRHHRDQGLQRTSGSRAGQRVHHRARRRAARLPKINNATRPMRAAAAARGDTERMSLWAGQGYRLAAELPAAKIIGRLRG